MSREVSTCNPPSKSTAAASKLSKATRSKAPTPAPLPQTPRAVLALVLVPLPAALLPPARLQLTHSVSTRPSLVSQLWEVFCRCCCKALGRRRFSSVSVALDLICHVLIVFFFTTPCKSKSVIKMRAVERFVHLHLDRRGGEALSALHNFH